MNIRKLSGEDREELLQYVYKELELNFFFVGDVESYGMDGEMVEVYAAESGSGWEWVFLLYGGRNGLLYSQKEDYDVESAANFMEALDKKQGISCISGKLSLIERLVPYFPDRRVEAAYMCRCNRLKGDALPDLPEGVAEHPVGEEGISEMIRFYLTIEEFRRQYEGRIEESIKIQQESLRAGNLAVGIYEDGQLVSVAATSAACRVGAMIVGVATREEYRGKGYARRAVSSLCRQAFENGCGFLCLFYDNPTAGKIYHSLGFETVGQYAMFR